MMVAVKRKKRCFTFGSRIREEIRVDNTKDFRYGTVIKNEPEHATVQWERNLRPVRYVKEFLINNETITLRRRGMDV